MVVGGCLNGKYEFLPDAEEQDSFGCQIFKVIDKTDQVERHLKRLSFVGNEDALMVQQEIERLFGLRHENVISYIAGFNEENEPSSYSIIAERFQGYTLADYIEAQKSEVIRTDELRILKWLIQISSALAEIHSKEILHRDLRPRNIFLSEDLEVARIGNFGLSIYVENLSLCSQSDAIDYMSPEKMKSPKERHPKSDCWSLGCILYELFLLKKALSHSMNFAANGFQVPNFLSKETSKYDYSDYDSLYQKLVKLDYNERPSASEVVSILKELKSKLVLDQVNVRAYLKQRELAKFGSVNRSQFKLLDPKAFQCFTKSTIAKIGFQELNLSDNRIKSIQAKTFDGLIYLRKINLFSNMIEHIDQEVFRPLANLQEINLAKNKLDKCPPNMFQSLGNLLKLNLAHNQLSILESNAFTGLKSLLVLDLSNNSIHTIEASVFASLGNSLEELNLQDNFIKTIKNLFTDLCKLKYLYLNGNKIESISSESLSSLTSLEEIYLNRNKISKIDNKAVENLKVLKILHLKENSLRNLPTDLFNGQIKLEILDLEGNQLSLIDHGSQATDTVCIQESVFNSNLAKLKSLNLAKNYQPPIFKPFGLESSELMENLTDLDLRWCSLDSIHLGMIKRLTCLKSLMLSHNKIEKIESVSFESLKKLKKLNLNKNRISIIESTAFHNQSQLEELTLAENQIESIESTVFKQLKCLVKLDLSANKLQTATITPELLANLTNLQTLCLNNNQIKSLGDDNDVESPFARLINLNELHLGRNKLETIHRNTFASLISLKTLNLQWNEITVFDPVAAFKGLVRLEELFLDGSKLQRSNINAIKEYFSKHCNTNIRIEFDMFSDLLADMNERVAI